MNNLLRKKMTWSTALVFVALIVTVPALLFTGCSNNPTAPTEATSFWDQPYALSAAGGRVIQASDDISAEVSILVPADSGGVVSFEANGYTATFAVPPAAIDSSADISVDATAESDRSGTVLVLEFGPDGLQFKESASLTVDARSISWDGKSKVSLYWLNPLTSRWVYQDEVSVGKDGQIKFSINHFSMYGIGGNLFKF